MCEFFSQIIDFLKICIHCYTKLFTFFEICYTLNVHNYVHCMKNCEIWNIKNSINSLKNYVS